MLQKNSIALKILTVFLAVGISAQSFAQTIKPSDEEVKRLEAEYQSQSDYTVPVVATVLVGGVVAAVGFYFFGPEGAAAGGAMAGMAAARAKHVTDSPAKMARLLDEANRFINSPGKR